MARTSRDSGAVTTAEPRNAQRKRELISFFVLAFGVWPVIAVGVVGGLGFAIWMWQIVYGPPGPPAGGLH